MSLTLADSWLENVERDGATIVYLIEMELGPAAYVTVNDYSLGAGDTVSIVLNGGAPVVLTEGTDFARGGTNTECATNIAAAMNASILTNSILAASRGQTVMVISRTPATSITTATGDASAWSITPEALEKTYYFASGNKTIGEYLLSVDDVSPFASSIDVITRETKIGDVEISFLDDGTVRDIFQRAKPKGKKVTIKIGTPEVAVADFAPYGVYVVDEVVPSEGGISVRCVEPISYALEADVTGEFVVTHPLACIREILSLASVPAAQIDDDTIESTDAAYATISHWAVSRHNYPWPWSVHFGPSQPVMGITTPTKAKELIDDLSALMDGSLRTKEDGVLSFVRYDAAAAVQRHWTVDDIDIEMVSTYENFANKVRVLGVPMPWDVGIDEEARTPLFTAEDSISRLMMAMSGAARDFSIKLSSNWLGDFGYLTEDLADSGSALTLTVADCTVAGFCGTRPDYNVGSVDYQSTAFTQRTEDTLSASRTAFLMITDGEHFEIVECEAYTTVVAAPDKVPSTVFIEPTLAGVPDTFGTYQGVTFDAVLNLAQIGQFTIKSGGRAAKGTTRRAWTAGWNTLVFDVTIPVSMAEARINRCSNGIPIARARTSLRHYDLQIGEFITLDSDIYLNFRKDGADSNTVWEIVAKEVQITDDSPAIVWTLAWVRDDVEFVASLAWNPTTGVPVVFTPTFDDVITDNNDVPVTQDSTGETLTRG